MAIATWFLWIRTKVITFFVMCGDWFHDLSQDLYSKLLKSHSGSASVQSLSHGRDEDVVNIFFAFSMDG